MHGMSIKNNKMTSHTGMSNAPRVNVEVPLVYQK